MKAFLINWYSSGSVGLNSHSLLLTCCLILHQLCHNMAVTKRCRDPERAGSPNLEMDHTEKDKTKQCHNVHLHLLKKENKKTNKNNLHCNFVMQLHYLSYYS